MHPSAKFKGGLFDDNAFSGNRSLQQNLILLGRKLGGRKEKAKLGEMWITAYSRFISRITVESVQ